MNVGHLIVPQALYFEVEEEMSGRRVRLWEELGYGGGNAHQLCSGWFLPKRSETCPRNLTG